MSVCTDRVAAMTGWLSGFTTWDKQFVSECKSMHCVIHREMLARQKMLPDHNSVSEDIIKVIHYIKTHALKSYLLEQLCEEMNMKHKYLYK